MISALITFGLVFLGFAVLAALLFWWAVSTAIDIPNEDEEDQSR
jgi:hypothetical protein